MIADYGPAVLVMHLTLALLGCLGLWLRASVSGRLLCARILIILFVVSPFLILVSPRPEVLASPPAMMGSEASLGVMSKVEVVPLANGALTGSIEATSINWLSISLCVWVLVVIALLGRLAWDLLVLRRHLYGLPEVSTEDREAICDHVKPTSCLVDATASGPYSVSLWRRVLVVPSRFVAETPPAQLAAILRHESAHLQRRDTMDAVLWRFLGAVFWWNPLIHLLGKRVVELQEWNADLASVNGKGEDALALSRALLGQAVMVRRLSLAHPMAASTAKQLKRRLRRLLQHPSGNESRAWVQRALWGVLLLGGVASHVACTSLLPSREIDHTIKEAKRAMDSERMQLEVEQKMNKVEGAIDSDDLLAIEIQFFEVEEQSARAPETSLLSPAETKAYIAELVKDRNVTQVAYPRVLTMNRRSVTIRSVINEPVVTHRNLATKTSEVDYIPVGTVIAAAPALLESGEIHCELDLTVSSILGKRLVGGLEFPVVSSRVYSAPLVMRSGHSVRIVGLDEAKMTVDGKKSLEVIVTITRLLPREAAKFR